MARDDKNDQYQAITFALLLLGLLAIIILILLFLSRKRMHREEIIENIELEAEEEEIRAIRMRTLNSRRTTMSHRKGELRELLDEKQNHLDRETYNTVATILRD